MAGRGPAPKPPGQRRNRSAPQRGEWVDLPPLKRAVLPPLRRRGKHEQPWQPRTRAMWEAWRRSAVTAMYGPDEIATAQHLAEVYDAYVLDGTGRMASEIRLLMDGLGLTPKGKRDLRWRVVEDDGKAAKPGRDELEAVRERRASRVRAVDPAASGQ